MKMGEPRVPKPRTQGDAKSSGPGSGALKPAIRSGNSTRMPGKGGVRTNSTTRPGDGTRGAGQTRNSKPRP
jgi:hypothetical protein